MECSEEWELGVEMADGGSEVRRRTQRQWISGAVDFYIFHIEGVPVLNHHFSKATRSWMTFYWIQSSPTRIAALVNYVTSSAFSVGQVTGLHRVHLQPCISHVKKPADSTQRAIFFSGVIKVTDKEQPNNRNHHSTSVCTLYAWHRFQTVHELKCPLLVDRCAFFYQWHHVDLNHCADPIYWHD